MRTHGLVLLLCLLASTAFGLSFRERSPGQLTMRFELRRPVMPGEEKMLETVEAYGHCLMEHDLERLEELVAPDYLEPFGVSGRMREVRVPGVRATVLEWETPGRIPTDRKGFIRSYEYFYRMYPQVDSIQMTIRGLKRTGENAEIDAYLLVRGQIQLLDMPLRPFENHAHFVLALQRQGRWLLKERRIVSLQTWLP